MRVIKSVKGHYEVQEVELGKVYRWCPGRILVECNCAKRLTLTTFATTCDVCGADHAALVRKELTVRRPEEDEATRPWRYWDSSEDTGIPF